MIRGARKFLGFALLGVVSAATGACVVHSDAPRGPLLGEIEFGELTNLHEVCGSPLASWTVTNRETGQQGTATCEQPVLFQGLDDNTQFTFDIQGVTYAGQVCWTGSCSVVAIGGTTTLADCSAAVNHLCGF